MVKSISTFPLVLCVGRQRSRIIVSDNLTFGSLDTETTGLSFWDDRIIQYGFSVFVRGVCVDRCSFDVCQTVPNSAFAINGISDSRIANGHPPLDMLLLLR